MGLLEQIKRKKKVEKEFKSNYDIIFNFSPKILCKSQLESVINYDQKIILLPANNLEFLESSIIRSYIKNNDLGFLDEEIINEDHFFQEYVKNLLVEINEQKNFSFGLFDKTGLKKYENIKQNKGGILSKRTIKSSYDIIDQSLEDLNKIWKSRNDKLNLFSIGEISLINPEFEKFYTNENLEYIAVNSVRNILNLEGTSCRDYNSTKKANFSLVYGGKNSKIRVRRSLEFKLEKNETPQVIF